MEPGRSHKNGRESFWYTDRAFGAVFGSFFARELISHTPPTIADSGIPGEPVYKATTPIRKRKKPVSGVGVGRLAGTLRSTSPNFVSI